MNLLNRIKWWWHLLLWTGLYLLWIFVFQNRSLTFSRSLGIEFCYLVFIALNFYVNAYYFIPKLLNRQKYLLFVLSSAIFFISTAWLRAEVVLFINATFYNIAATQIDFTKLYFNSLLNIFIWTEFLVAAKIIIDKLQFQRYAELVEKEKILNELNFLRAQNNPHFLFNTLNSIYFQIDKSNKNARETLMRLSEMLRYQLYECTVEKILIDKEIAYLENYIELEKLRLNNNYNIAFTVENEVKGFSIAPLLLLPLIENAFKYVSHFSQKCNEIKVNLSLKNDWLECSIINSIEKAATEPATTNGGIGLKNLRRRLELLYPDKHSLVIDENENWHSVQLNLQVHED